MTERRNIVKRNIVWLCVGGAILAGILAAGYWWKRQPVPPVVEQAAPPAVAAPAVAASMAARANDAALPAPRLPVPPLARIPERHAVPRPAAPDREETGLVKATQLPVGKLEDYLRTEGRSLASLLAAARISGDRALLEEALEAFPDNPQVLLDWLMRGDVPDELRLEALQAFCEAAPQNALGDYLLALEQFRAGNMDQAMNAIIGGFTKPVAESYVLLQADALAAAYRAAGYSAADAAATGYYGVTLETVAPLRELADWILAVGEGYAAAGDADSARLMSLMGARLGSQMELQTERLLIMEELTGMNIERQFLSNLDPASELVAGGQTVGQRLQELQVRGEEIKAVVPAAQGLDALDDVAKLRYFEELAAYGEVEALKRLLERQ